MMSSATKVKGQGVGSAYIEQVNLVREGLGDKFEVFENAHMKADITHYHTINPGYYLGRKSKTKKGRSVGYVHMQIWAELQRNAPREVRSAPAQQADGKPAELAGKYCYRNSDFHAAVIS